MESKIGPSFKKVKSSCYRKHKDGFYVYAKPNKCDPKTAIKYIGRYLGRPVISASRIDKYNGDFVTFHYNRHEDDSYVEETLPVMEFIERLIRHIPEKHFKMIRYGGIYARHREIDKKLYRIISREKHRIFRSFNQRRTAILSAFGYDPLKCECGANMLFLELYFNHKRIPLEEMYENVMCRNYYVNTIFQPRHLYRNTIFKLSALIYMNIHFPFLHIYQQPVWHSLTLH